MKIDKTQANADTLHAIQEKRWIDAALNIEKRLKIKQSPNLQSLLGVCYFLTPDKQQQGVTLLTQAIKTKRVSTELKSNYVALIKQAMSNQQESTANLLANAFLQQKPSGQTEIIQQYKILIFTGQAEKALALCKHSEAGEDLLQAQIAKPFHQITQKPVSGRPNLLCLIGTIHTPLRKQRKNDTTYLWNWGNCDFNIVLNQSAVNVTFLYINPTLKKNETQWQQLIAQHSIVLNMLTNARAHHDNLTLLQEWEEKGFFTKIINPPSKILQTGRDRVYAQCKNIRGGIFPKVLLIDDKKAPKKFNFPVIARPLCSSAGRGLEKLDDLSSLTHYLESLILK